MSNNSAGRSYTPLADEVNPSFGNTASTSTVRRNGTIVYAKRVASSSSSTSTDSEEREPDLDRQESNFRSESEVTLSASSIQKGKERATNGHGLGFEEADLGEMRREGLKGTEKRWDLEQGTAEMEGGEGRYPPLNETEEEERRVQEVSRFYSECSWKFTLVQNLARFAARDMARRRAARVSRQLPSSPIPGSPPSSSSSSNFMRRPLSYLSSLSSSTEGKLNSSIVGLMDGIIPKGKGTSWPDSEVGSH